MRSAFALGLIVSAALTAGPAAAQVPYSVAHGTAPFSPFSGGTVHSPVAYSVFPALDEGVVTLALPFTFNWYGVDYSTVYVYTNGFISFSAPTTMGILGPPRTVPSPVNTIHDYVGVLWADLVAGASGSIRSRVTGSSGSRIFEIQLLDYERNGAPSGSSGVSFQIRLFEGTSSVQIAYGPTFGIVSATAAMENFDGTQGENLMAASATCVGSCICAPRQCDSINFGGMGGRTISIDLPNQAEVQGTISAPPGAFAGASFDADITVLNAGLAAAGPFSYAVMLSPSNTSTAGAVTLASFSAPSGLAALGSTSATIPLTVPGGTAVGDFYIALVVDTAYQVSEVSEANNAAYSGLFRTGPELTGSVAGPTEAGPNEPLDVQLTLQNEGAPVVSPVRVQFYLSPTQAVDGSAIPVPPAQMVTLPDGFSTTETITLTTPASVPPSPPNFYVIAVLDDGNAIAETDETNNVLVSANTLQVRGADVQVDSFVSGDFAFRGLPYPLTTVVSNVGAASARDFSVCVFLSDNPLISVISDVRLIETALITLAPGESRTLRLEPVIPAATAPGTWYVASVADCGTVVAEPVETNNTARREDTITVIDPTADFTPVQIDTSSAAAAGETLPVAVQVANIGNADGAAAVRILLSDNPGVTLQDTLLYETPAPVPVTMGEQVSISSWVALPPDLGTGNYYIGAIVDPEGLSPEILEDNNSHVIGPLLVVGADLAIVSPTPPHPVIGNPYAWRFAAAGGAGPYTWTATWDSGAPPMGLSFDASTAELSGTPPAEAEGSYGLTVRVQAANLYAEASYMVLVSPPTLPLTVVSSRLPPAVATEPYAVQLVAVGGVPPYDWSLSSFGPPGISVAADGTLGGEPQIVGPSSFTVVVRDQLGQRATGLLSIDVVDPSASITITTADVPSGIAGQEYQTAFNAAGGEHPYTWRLDGDVPPGLLFNATTAQLTGTPTVAGEYAIEVEVRDAMGLLDRNGYVLEIFEEGALRIITGSSDDERLPDAEVGQAFLQKDGSEVRLIADPPEGVRWMLVNGALPPGLGLDDGTGVISGTPTRLGAFAFTVLAMNEANDLRRRSLVIYVAPEGGDVPPEIGGGCRCVPARRPAANLGLGFGLMLLGLAARSRRRRGAG